jgi:HEPN domain-containing protein
MSEDRNLGEARRWLGQALHDRDAARLNATRYPNGLPAGIPHEFYDRTLADQALGDLETVLACVQRFVRS